jgi:hypothetical protein
MPDGGSAAESNEVAAGRTVIVPGFDAFDRPGRKQSPNDGSQDGPTRRSTALARDDVDEAARVALSRSGQKGW